MKLNQNKVLENKFFYLREISFFLKKKELNEKTKKSK